MNMPEFLNTIHANASAQYQSRIPVATDTNIESIRYAMLDDDNIQVANEFIGTMLNKLVKSVVHVKMFNNPLKMLKKGNKPLGDTIEEIYVNFIKGKTFDDTGAELLKRNLPDVKTVYHRKNYEMQYDTTISRERLKTAFQSYDSLESFITTTINTLYNSAELDEFINIKQIFKSAYDNNAMIIKNIADPCTSEANAKEFIKTVKVISNLMQFPSEDYNAYLTAQDTDTKPITTFTRKSEQILIIDTVTDTSLSIDVLASIFNMSVAEFNDTRKIVIDVFPVNGMRAALVDEAFFQIFDDLFAVTSFFNGKGIYNNYYLTIMQTIAYSILVNAVAFVVPET